MVQLVEFEGTLHEFPDDFNEVEIGEMLDNFDPNTLDNIFDNDGIEVVPPTTAMQDGIHQPELQTISAEEEAELFPDSDLRAREEELPPMNAKLEGFYNRITTIEADPNTPWIRTKVKPVAPEPGGKQEPGSTAYGPRQITRGLVAGYLKNKRSLFTEKEIEAMNEMAERQRISSIIGGDVDRPKHSAGGVNAAQGEMFAKRFGFETVDEFLTAFDYGGDLGLSEDVDFKMQYESFSRKMLQDHLKGAKGDEMEAAARWHGGLEWSTAKSKKGTAAYRKKYQALLDKQ